MPTGDFNQEAYEQLRQAYADQLVTQADAEEAGKEIMGQEMTLETLPVDSPWKNAIENWEYPDGRSVYLDGKQSPEEILEIMRDSARAAAGIEPEDDGDVEEMSDEEFDAYIDEILKDEDAEVEEETVEPTAEAEETEEPETEEPVAETEEVEEETEETEEEEEEETYDPESVAEAIAALRAELDELTNPTLTDTEEDDDDEP